MKRAAEDVTSLWVKTDEPLLWLGGAGHETRSEASYKFDCRQRFDRPHYVLQLTLAGAGFYERRGVQTLLLPGMAFLDRIPGDFRYGYPPNAREPYEQAFISMTGPSAESLCRRITDSFGHVLRVGRESAVQAMVLSLAHQFTAGTLRDRYLTSGRLYQLLMMVLSTLKSSQAATGVLMREAIAMVDAEAQEHEFNVSSMALALKCSREHLTRQFRHATGVSAGDYITQHRLGTAASLLRQTADKLDVIASRSGFRSANYLCRAFRKKYGITPAQFRRTPWLVAD